MWHPVGWYLTWACYLTSPTVHYNSYRVFFLTAIAVTVSWRNPAYAMRNRSSFFNFSSSFRLSYRARYITKENTTRADDARSRPGHRKGDTKLQLPRYTRGRETVGAFLTGILGASSHSHLQHPYKTLKTFGTDCCTWNVDGSMFGKTFNATGRRNSMKGMSTKAWRVKRRRSETGSRDVVTAIPRAHTFEPTSADGSRV